MTGVDRKQEALEERQDRIVRAIQACAMAVTNSGYKATIPEEALLNFSKVALILSNALLPNNHSEIKEAFANMRNIIIREGEQDEHR